MESGDNQSKTPDVNPEIVQSDLGSPSPSLSVQICSTPDCNKPSTMQCPTCVKYNGPSSYFCSQECFQLSWKDHSKCHVELKARAEFKPWEIKYTGPLRPAYVTPQITVDDPNIPKPEWADTGRPVQEQRSKWQRDIPIYTPEEINGIREACQLGRRALDLIAPMVKPGVTTEEINKVVHDYIVSQGAYPSPLNYSKFPKSLCTSINEVICHGIPDLRPLEDGDIINLDVSVYYKGYHGDLNETFTVGNVDFDSKRLIKATYDATMEACQAAKPGMLFRDFGELIGKSVARHGFDSVRSFCGHGIGHLFHCAPNVFHYAKNKSSGVCKPGMIFTIEPMINMGSWKDALWPDDWTAVTIDGKRSAQFEHAVLVTETGFEILTERTADTPRLLWWEMDDEQNKADLIRYNEYVANPPKPDVAALKAKLLSGPKRRVKK